jgi:flagellar motor component MotA
MLFDDMPKKTYIEIINDMKERFIIWNDKYSKVNEELAKLNKLKQEVKRQGAGNIEDKLDKLIYDMNFERGQLNINRRFFYTRLKWLDLIEENSI